MAIEGNPVGAGIWFALILAIFWVRMHALEFGYKQGVKLVTDFSEKLPNLTAAASVLGLTVVGCLIASVIGVTCRLASASATSRWRFSRCSTRSCLP